MKKLLLPLIFSFLFFGCASKDAESEINSEIAEVTPIIEETEVGESVSVLENVSEEFLDTVVSDDFYIIEESETSPEEKPTQEETLESLEINPDDFEAPDYVEFLPIIVPKTTEDLENLPTVEETQVLEETEIVTETTEIPEEQIEEVLPLETEIQEEILEEVIQETEKIEEEPILNENILEEFENQATETTQDFNQIEEIITDNGEITEENIQDDTEDFLPETDDIPLEEIFIPDEEFVPPEPEETITIKENRSMIMNNHQKLMVSFPGNGWIFLGDEYNSDTLTFDKRNIYEDSTEFLFKSTNSGEALLHFFKQDLLTNEPINDYLLVSINPKKGKFETIEAPEYTFSNYSSEEFFEEEEILEEEYYDYGIIEDEPEVMFFTDEEYFFEEDNFSAKEVLDLAQAFYDDEMHIEALDQLDYYFSAIGENPDEYTDYALFLKAQLLEKNTPIKNIKESLIAYKKLIDNFPDSKYWNTAKQRAIYLERFYFSGR